MAKRQGFGIGERLGVVQDTSELADYSQNHSNADKMVIVVDKSVDIFDEDPVNNTIYAMSDIDTLAETIKQHGIEEPLSAYQKPDGRLMIRSGHRRLMAAKKVGLKKVPVRILPWEDDANVRLQYLIINNSNRVKTQLEVANEIAQYMNTLNNMTQTQKYAELSKVFGKSDATIRRLLGVTMFIPELKEKVSQPDIYSFVGLCEAVSMDQAEQEKFNQKIDEYMAANGSATKEALVSIAKQVKAKTKGVKVAKKIPPSFEEDSDKFIKKCKRYVRKNGNSTVDVLEKTIKELTDLRNELKK